MPKVRKELQEFCVLLKKTRQEASGIEHYEVRRFIQKHKITKAEIDYLVAEELICDYISEENIELYFKLRIGTDQPEIPTWLFTQQVKASDASSARFNPNNALSGENAWEASIVPSTESTKKTIIVDLTFFNTNDAFIRDRRVRQTIRLVKEGFDVYYKSNDGDFVKINPDFRRELLDNIAAFKPQDWDQVGDKLLCGQEDAVVMYERTNQEIDTLFCNKINIAMENSVAIEIIDDSTSPYIKKFADYIGMDDNISLLNQENPQYLIRNATEINARIREEIKNDEELLEKFVEYSIISKKYDLLVEILKEYEDDLDLSLIMESAIRNLGEVELLADFIANPSRWKDFPISERGMWDIINLGFRNGDESNVILAAVQNGDIKVLRPILEKCAAILKSRQDDGSDDGGEKLVELMNLDESDVEISVLAIAAKHLEIDIFREVLSFCAKTLEGLSDKEGRLLEIINKKDQQHCALLSYLILNEREEFAIKVIDCIAELYQQKKLTLAEYAAIISPKGRSILSPIGMAIDNKQYQVLDLLLKIKKGIDPKFKMLDADTTENLVRKKDPELTKILKQNHIATFRPKIMRCTKKNPDGRKASGGDEKAEYVMKEAGKVLNISAKKIRVRDDVLRIRDIDEDGVITFQPQNNPEYLDFTDVKNEEFDGVKVVETNFSAQKLKDKYKGARQREKGTFCSFKAELKLGELTKLTSLDCQEKMASFSLPPEVEIEEFQKDEHGFYWVKVKAKDGAKIGDSCEIGYVINIPPKALLAKSSPENYVIQDGKRFEKRYRKFTAAPQIQIKSEEVDPESGEIIVELDKESWLADMYRGGSGACGYRSAAFVHHMKRWDKKEGIDLRIVGINNNHIAVEAYDETSGVWHYVDLGGIASTIINEYDDDDLDLDVADDYVDVADLDNDDEFNVTEEGYEEFSDDEEEEEVNAPAEASAQDVGTQKVQLQAASQGLSHFVAASVKDKEVAPIAKILLSKVQFVPLKSAQEVANIVTNPSPSKRSKTLIVASDYQISRHMNLLLAEAIKSGREVFCINKPSDIDVLKKVIAIAQVVSNSSTSPAEVQAHGFLRDFLTKRDAQAAPPLIIINWDNFSAKEITALNTILDESATIQGQEANCDICSLASEGLQDTSFISRHNVLYESKIDLAEKAIEHINIRQLVAADERNPGIIQQNRLIVPRKIIAPNGAVQQVEEMHHIFDFEGFDNYKQKLFGNISLYEDRLIWHKSDFVNLVEEGRNKFIFSNISEAGKRECMSLINQANAQGYLFHAGKKIVFGQPLEVSFSELQFDFEKFSPHYISAVQATVASIPHDAHIINPSLFDALLYDKEIIGKKYKELEGLIAQHAKASQQSSEEAPLKLFISADLTTSQYYCLFNQAMQQNVRLQLYLAPNVKLPPEAEKVAYILDPQRLQPVRNKALQAEIIAANDVDQIKRLGGPNEDIIIDVEDYSCADLIEKINFRINEQGDFVDFERQESDLMRILKSLQGTDRKIVLRGDFSNSLLQTLAPILFEDYAKNLVLLVQDKEIAQESLVSKRLEWLATPQTRNALYFEPLATEQKRARMQQATKIENVALASDIASPNLAAESALFLQQRKALFEDVLRDNLAVKLVGASGVGKSYLVNGLDGQDAAINMIAEGVPAKSAGDDEQPESDGSRKRKASADEQDDFNPKRKKEAAKQTYKVYNSLDDLVAISQAIEAGSQDLVHVLFLDESNITNKHFTMFKNAIEAAKANHEKDFEILYKGKLHKFNLQNFRIVFAQNPHNYGGGRKKQRLFEDVVVPEIHLQNLPIGVIYQEVLHENIFRDFSDDIKSIAGFEEKFRTRCGAIIEKYQQTNLQFQDEPLQQQTVRELQEDALKFTLEILREQNPQDHKTIISKNFTSSQATKTIEDSLRDCLEIRRHQQNGDFPARTGLNGVLLEGGSGIGKTSLIEAIQAEYGVKFYKIDASMPKEEKKAKILQAFHEGSVVWIDEINSCIDDGLEQVLNSVLDGIDPDTGEPALVCGFKLFASSNQASKFRGRSIIGPALRHRLNCPRVSELSEYTDKDIAEIMMNWVKYDDDLKSLVRQITVDLEPHVLQASQDFLKLVKDPKQVQFNLRNLRDAMGEFLQELKQQEVARASTSPTPLQETQLAQQRVQSVSV